MMPKHSNLGPSSAERWWNCAGSIRLSAAAPKPAPNIHAAEGTVAHELCEEFVTGKLSLQGLKGRVGRMTECDGFEIEVTDEMVEAVLLYEQTINEDFLALGEGAIGFAEHRVVVSSVSPDLYGTADYISYVKGGKLIVYDFKYGKGVSVSVEGNKQMAIYALGVLDTLALGDEITEIELVVIQPRAGGDAVRRWEMTAWWQNQFKKDLIRAVADTKLPDSRIVAGAWCRWCPAFGSCPAAEKRTQELAVVDFSQDPLPLEKGKLPDISKLPVNVLAKALEHEDYVSGWFEAVRLNLKHRLDNGEDVPGYKLVAGRATRKFIDDLKVIEEFEDTLGIERLLEPRKLITPAKLEKLVGKGKIDHLTFKPEGGKSIVRDSDPRPAIKNRVELDFEALPPTAEDL